MATHTGIDWTDPDVLDITSSGTLKIAGTTVTATADQLNTLASVTAGTVTASKHVVVDTNKDIGDFRNLDAVNFDAGLSGTAGSLDVFPTTAAKGKLTISAADSAGDTTTTVTNASQAGARTYTIPDAGASANFVMSEGAQTLNSTLTLTVPVVEDHNTGITAFATGGQASATALTGRWNNVTTCATAGDSVKLLTAVAGQVQTVKNSGATTLAVFPNTSDAINALAVDLSVDIPPGGELTFRALDGTTWETIESLYLPAPTTQTGGLEIKAADSAANYTTTITNASMGQATTITIPDPGGAAASAVLTEAAQTINGVKTFAAAPVFQAGPVLPLLTAANIGTPGTNVTAVEYGDGFNHVTVLTLAAVELTPTIPADAEGAGAVIYTFPAGVYAGHMAHMDITGGVMDAATNAADVGLGSLIASGDIATLTTAAMEDWVTGQTVANVQTFVVEKSTVMTAGASLVFEAGGSHTLNLNVAATWNGTVATASVTGTVTLKWTFLGA